MLLFCVVTHSIWIVEAMSETDLPIAVTSERRRHRRRVAVLLWRLVALLAFALGIVGAFLPVLPTVPFLLVAAWAAGKGWPAFEAWLLRHPSFGPPVERWRKRGAIGRGTKWLATGMMAASAIVLQLFGSMTALWVRIFVPLFLLAMCVWLWLRPEQ